MSFLQPVALSPIIEKKVVGYPLDSGLSLRTRYEERYINNSQHTVYLKRRNGFVIEVPAEYGSLDSKLVIRLRQCLDKDRVIEARHSYAVDENINSTYFPSVDAYKDLLGGIETSSMQETNIRDVVLDLRYDIDTFVMTEVYYCNESDYLLSLDVNALTEVTHPAQRQLEPKEMSDDQINASQSILVEIVDNEAKLSPRYMMLADKVIEVLPIRNKSKKDGIYFYYKEGEDNDSYNEIIFPLDSPSNKVMLFKTPEEASTFGDAEIAKQKLRYQQLQAEEVRILKDLEMSAVQRESKVAEARMKTEDMSLNSQYQQAKMDLELRNDRASTNNKFLTEMLKMIPLVLTTGALIYKFSNS